MGFINTKNQPTKFQLKHLQVKIFLNAFILAAVRDKTFYVIEDGEAVQHISMLVWFRLVSIAYSVFVKLLLLFFKAVSDDFLELSIIQGYS